MKRWNIIRKIDGGTVASVEAIDLIDSTFEGVTRKLFIGADDEEVLQLVIDESEYEVRQA